MSVEVAESKERFPWPDSYDLGATLASAVLRFRRGMYDGFKAETVYDMDELRNALAAQYGQLLLDVWLGPYRQSYGAFVAKHGGFSAFERAEDAR